MRSKESDTFDFVESNINLNPFLFRLTSFFVIQITTRFNSSDASSWVLHCFCNDSTRMHYSAAKINVSMHYQSNFDMLYVRFVTTMFIKS